MHSDSSAMVTIGKIDPIIQKLVIYLFYHFRLKYLKSLYIKEFHNVNQEIKLVKLEKLLKIMLQSKKCL